MLGALKCSSGTGVRMLRTVTPPNASGISVSPLESYAENCCGSINWSQKRFLRCLPPVVSSSGPVNVNAQFAVNEIEAQHRRILEASLLGNKMPSGRKSLKKENRRSVRAHQAHLLTLLPEPVEEEISADKFVADMFKIIIENGAPTVRVKSKKDDTLVKEWIGIQNELQIIKTDRIEEDKRRLQIAGQQALREMEASLRKGMNLEDLDEAIEGALCSELKDQ